jgi:hypothetical protein
MANNCYECPYHEKVGESSTCNLLREDVFKMFVASMIKNSIIKNISDFDGNEIIRFDPIGFEIGDFFWPINYNPLWVTCEVDVNKQVADIKMSLAIK